MEQTVTLLNCIERIPSVIDKITREHEEMFRAFLTDYEAHEPYLNEIVLIGSGTSNTVSITARPFMESVSGLPVRTVYPNEAIADWFVPNLRAMHVFISQTGTSAVVCDVMRKLKAAGCFTVSLTDSPESMLAGISPCHICLNCGKEEYLMRTIGYTASVLNLMLMGLEIGRIRGNITMQEYKAYLEDLRKVPESHARIIRDAERWFEKNKRKFIRARCIVFTGADDFYGLSLEAAVKFWEMPQVIAMGYELEEGLHGPNYGYDYPHCVIVLNGSARESQKALSLARYMKEVFHNGFVVGEEVVDGDDLKLETASRWFRVLEYSAVPQVCAYYLAVDGGRDLLVPADHSVMDSYFTTHMR